jgi:elongation factor Ts
MQITAQMVSQLREQTGAGMMECKKALTEAEGDVEKARDILRSRGKAGAEKRAGRSAAEGVVASATGSIGTSLIELNSETDFVARNDEFKSLAQNLAQIAADTGISNTEALLQQPFPGGITAKQALEDVLTKLRENIVFRRAVVYPSASGSVTASYIHAVTNKLGSLVELKSDATSDAVAALAKDIAMHVAANRPEYARREDVPAEAVEKEKLVLAELTRNEGKPEAAIPKIVEGRLGKFFERVCLEEQPFVKDGSKRINELLEETKAKLVRFDLFAVGQE